MYKDITSHYTLYKRGPYWGYYYYDKNNKRHFRSTGRKTRYEAQKVIADRIKDGELGFSASSNILFKDYAKDFFIPGKCPYEAEKMKLDKKISATTLSTYRASLDSKWMPILSDIKLKDITQEIAIDCRMKLKDKGLKGSSINAAMFVLGIILSTAVKQKIIEKNPLEDIERLSTKDSNEKEAFTADDIKKILAQDWDNSIYRDIFIVACMTGMRIGEIIALKRSSIKDGYIEVSSSYSSKLKLIKDTKNHKIRKIPLSSELEEVISSYYNNVNEDYFIFNIAGSPINYRSFWTKFDSILDAAGIEGNKSFHSTRHFFDSRLYLDEGIDKERIKAVMGHSSDDMFRHYLHIEDKALDSVKRAQENIGRKIIGDKVDDTQ